MAELSPRCHGQSIRKTSPCRRSLSFGDFPRRGESMPSLPSFKAIPDSYTFTIRSSTDVVSDIRADSCSKHTTRTVTYG
jgi:hypothetical protein